MSSVSKKKIPKQLYYVDDSAPPLFNNLGVRSRDFQISRNESKFFLEIAIINWPKALGTLLGFEH